MTEMAIETGDDIAEIVAFQVFQLTYNKLGERLRMAGFGDDTGKLAALCGATPQQVFLWERGELAPTTTQALAWMRALRTHQPGNPWAALDVAYARRHAGVAEDEPEPA
jgi:hypothetical protein